MNGRGPERILFIRTDRLGDLLMNVPAFARLRRNFPKSRIEVLASGKWAPAVQCQPDIDAVLPFDAREAATPGGKAALWRRLSAARYDMIVVSNPSKFFHALAFALRAPLRAGLARKWGFLLNRPTRPFAPGDASHEIERNLAVLDPVCPEPWDGRIDLGFGAHPAYARIVERLRVPAGRRAIAIHASTSDPRKYWPVDRFRAVIKEFLEKTDHPVVLIGEDEGPLGRMGEAGRGRLHDLRGHTSLEELAVLLREARCLVSPDSGPYHVAWMQKTPVVGLFPKEAPGSDPRRWGVYRGFADCREIRKASADIGEREVIEAVYSLLEAPYAAG